MSVVESPVSIRGHSYTHFFNDIICNPRLTLTRPVSEPPLKRTVRSLSRSETVSTTPVITPGRRKRLARNMSDPETRQLQNQQAYRQYQKYQCMTSDDYDDCEPEAIRRQLHFEPIDSPQPALTQSTSTPPMFLLDPTKDREGSAGPNTANSINETPTKSRGIKRKQDRSTTNRIRDGMSRSDKDLLVAGFIRRNPMDQCYTWPHDLTNMVLEWYEETSYWSIRGEQMEQFRSTGNGQTMYGPKFEVGRLCHFETTLCPNGWKPNQEGSCQFYIEMAEFPEEVSSITLYYELRCRETGSYCKKIRTFRNKADAQSWGTNNMRFLDCQNLESLEMTTFVKVLRVEYTKSDEHLIEQTTQPSSRELLFHPELLSMSSDIASQWKISPELLHTLSTAQEGKFFYSHSFGGVQPKFDKTGHTFCFEMAPSGWHSTNRGQAMIYLRLLGLPLNVQSIGTLIQFRGDLLLKDGEQRELYPAEDLEHTFCYLKHGVHLQFDETLLQETMRQSEEMLVTIRIEVTQVVSRSGELIPRENWEDFDIYNDYSM